MTRWNRIIEKAGIKLRAVACPSPRFRRTIGIWADVPTDPAGKPIDAGSVRRARRRWLPSGERPGLRALSLMQRVVEPGKMAAWIAPPDRGINNLPVDYEYVKLH